MAHLRYRESIFIINGELCIKVEGVQVDLPQWELESRDGEKRIEASTNILTVEIVNFFG